MYYTGDLADLLGYVAELLARPACHADVAAPSHGELSPFPQRGGGVRVR